MGHIKEPKGIDFIIKSEPLTQKEQEAISAYINSYKMRNSKKNTTGSRKIKNNKSIKKPHVPKREQSAL